MNLLRCSMFCLLAFGLAARAPVARAQSYGSGGQVLTIGAAEFESLGSFGPFIDSDQYLYYSGGDRYMAPLLLPEGASIEKLCLYANDSDPGALEFVDAFLIAVKLTPAGEAPGLVAVGAGAYSSSNIGYGYYCSQPFSYTLRARTDVDGDGSLDSAAYYVYADIPLASQGSVGLGGVQVAWKLQVSPAPALPTFGDVPTSDPAFAPIEALVASEITAGCAVGNFCPDASLTRRQMAVFLGRALGLHRAD